MRAILCGPPIQHRRNASFFMPKEQARSRYSPLSSAQWANLLGSKWSPKRPPKRKSTKWTCCGVAASFEVSKCEIEHVIHGKTERLPLLDKNSDGTVPKPLFPVAKILSGVQSLGIS